MKLTSKQSSKVKISMAEEYAKELYIQRSLKDLFVNNSVQAPISRSKIIPLSGGKQ